VGKYDPLVKHFRYLTGNAWHATFKDIEKILGFPLPPSARAYPAWWANSADMPQKGAWLEAGWRTRDLNLSMGHVLFVREAAAAPEHHRQQRQANIGTTPQPQANAAHAWETANTVELRVGFAWAPIGRVMLGADGKLVFPAADAVPAIYRFRIRQGDAERRYIGQTENLARRLGHYKNPGPTQHTNIRMNAEFVQALAAGLEISVAAVIGGAWIEGGAGKVAADMSSTATRCLLENAAILADRATGIESLNRSEAGASEGLV
jgi:hypothetical protein